MKTTKFSIVIIIVSVLFAISVILFCWTLWGKFDSHLAINSGRFSDFGSFIGGIFGTLSFILLIITLKETKEQSFDTSFFNHLQLHDTIVQQLKSSEKEISTLNIEYTNLFSNNLCSTINDTTLQPECNTYSSFSHDGYFEAMYAMLHVRYKYLQESPWTFFKDNNWRIGHFLNSFTSVVELISEGNFTDKKRGFYVRLVNARATSDEVRLLFYFVTFNGNPNEKIRLINLFKSLKFFDNLRDGLIKQGDMELFKNFSP